MAGIVARDLVNLFKSEKNGVYVDPERLVTALNTKLLNANLISPDFFRETTLDDARNILHEILSLSIDKRIEMLGGKQSLNMIRDIMIQNLDFQ
jgi:hypothetical protein